MAADTSQSSRRFSREELAQFDGKEGRAAYVLYRGKVHDVTGSKLWRNGKHVNAHFAGNDLTSNMAAAPHEEDVLDRFPVVGILFEEVEKAAAGPPKLVQLILDRHPHPISVHFPIALGLVAALFTALALLYHEQPVAYTFRESTYYLLLVCVLSTPPAIATGLLSWVYNYSTIWTPIYRMKVGLSVVLVVLSLAALIIRWAVPPEVLHGGVWYWTYTLIVLVLGPVVVGLGYYGGKITFPS